MIKNPSFIEHLLELYRPMGGVSARRMFGGYGFFKDGLMFALVANDELFLKADNMNRSEFADPRLNKIHLREKGQKYSPLLLSGSLRVFGRIRLSRGMVDTILGSSTAKMSFLSIHNILFTVWGYPMSLLEFSGTLLNVLSVWLVVRKNVWNWPVGIVAVILFGFLFYQIRLYSDLLEQGYFLVTGFYGWWAWAHSMARNAENNLAISTCSKRQIGFTILVVIAGSIALGYLMSVIHVIWPKIFPEPASYPYLDAFTTMMSFAAQILLAHKKIENWYLWIVVDAIGIGLYYAKDVKFVALLYVIFLILAIRGLLTWRKDLKR